MVNMGMYLGEGGKPSEKDVQLVCNCVEHCIKQYMSKKETINALAWENIPPEFTEIIWERLEESNKTFFRAYYISLLVKDQIEKFNSLLKEQAALMHKSSSSQINTGLASDGFNAFPARQFSTPNSAHGTLPIIADEIDQINEFRSYGSSFQAFIQGNFNQSVRSTLSGFSPNMLLSQNSSSGLQQTMNGQMQIVEPHLNYNPPSNFPESHLLVDDASVLHSNGLLSDAHHLNSLIQLDSDARLLEQHNVVTPQIAANLTSSYDIEPGNYNQLLFPATGTAENFDPNATNGMLDPAAAEMLLRKPF